MTATPTASPEAYREFLATADRAVRGTEELTANVAGLFYAGLVLAAQGTKEVRDSAASTTSGP